MAKISAIVLAAGTSNRMGEANKLLLPWKEHSIVDEVIENIRTTSCHELIVVTSELTLSHFAQNHEFKLVENNAYLSGMTSSIQVGVNAVSSESEAYMICLADQPTLNKATYQKIMDRFSNAFRSNPQLILAPYYKGKKGNPVIFSSQYKEDILNHKEPEGCREIIIQNVQHLEKVELEEESILLDIDTPDKYQQVKKKFLGI